MATFTANVANTYIVPIPLSANLTNITLTGALDGQQVVLEFQQNATGGFTVASSSIAGLQQPVATALTNSFQVFIYNLGLTEWQALNTGGSSGVSSLNSLTGALTLAAGSNVTITPSGGNTLTVASTGGGGGGVTSLNSLTGALAIAASGSGIVVSPSGSNIDIANSGVTSILSGGGVLVSNPTGVVTLSNAQNMPWLDIQNFGGQPKAGGVADQTTSYTTVGGTPNVTLGSTRALFANGTGICLYQAGNATTQSTPSAPTITSPVVQGAQTIIYKAVGYDAMGGLTAASSPQAVTNAPKIFGPLPQVISSITATGGVVTVTFAGPLNNAVSTGMTLHIVKVTGSGATWNGIWTIASVISTSEVTYNVSGATGTGTVSASSTGRVSNTAIITSVVRSSVGVLTINTAVAHNYHAGSVNVPTVINVEGVLNATGISSDLNGWYPIATASGTTITTFPCGIFTAETGVLVTGSSTATVWEYNKVVCPALSGTTIGYYIYSDSINPGGSLVLIGKVTLNEATYIDWGPFYSQGYVAPAYVPTSPPAFAQNQMFSALILSGGGTPNLVLNANVPTSVSGGTALYDDSAPMRAALAEATFEAGISTLFLSPPRTVGGIVNPLYAFQSPVTYTKQTNLIFGCSCVINETLSGFNECQISAQFGAPFTSTPSFGLRNYMPLLGFANPMITSNVGIASTGVNVDGLLFQSNFTNGQNLLQLFFASYSSVTNCAFTTENFGTNIGLMLNGNCSQVRMSNICTNSGSILGDNSGGPVLGQSDQGPLVPAISIRCSDNPVSEGVPPSQIFMDGINTFEARGIGVDQTQFIAGEAFNFVFGTSLWDQAPTQPLVWFMGGGYVDVQVVGAVMDSDDPQVVGNFGFIVDLTVDKAFSLGNLVTGNAVTGLTSYYPVDGPAGQNVNALLGVAGFGNVGSANVAPPKISQTIQAQSMSLTSALFCPVTLTAPTATASGSGSIPAGTYAITMSAVGWDGGETQPSAQTFVTVNGSQGIQVGYTIPSGMQGAFIFIGEIRQNLTFLTGTTVTYTVISSNGGLTQLDGTGLPLMNSTGLYTPLVVMPEGLFKLSLAPPTLTANRTMVYADGANSSVVSTTLTTTSGGSPYTVTLQGATSSSHAWLQETNVVGALDRAAGNVWISGVGTNTVTVNTGVTTGETFNIFATVN